MLREARLVGALGDTGVPVATLLTTAQTDELIDVHFYVMRFAAGSVVTTDTPPPLNLHRLHRDVDPREHGGEV